MIDTRAGFLTMLIDAMRYENDEERQEKEESLMKETMDEILGR